MAATALVTASLLGSCDNGCEQTRENYMHARVISTSGRQMRRMSFFMVSGQYMTQSGNVTKLDDFEVKINPKDSVTYLFCTCEYSDYGDSFMETDTIRIDYQTTPRFLDLSCGCTVTYHITDVASTHALFTRTTIDNADVEPGAGINLTIEY